MAPEDIPTIRIDDPADARIGEFRDIRERDLVKNQRSFIAEGRTVLQVLVDQRHFPIRALLILENRVAGLQPLLARLPAGTPVYVAGQSVMDAIAGFHIHRGILALAGIPSETLRLPPDLPGEWNTVLMLSAISNHDNMGGIFRNAAAFGVDAVLMDSQCCDPLYRKAVRVSVGGVLRVPFFRMEKLDDGVAALERAGFEIAALSPTGKTVLSRWCPSPRQALVLGTEGAGLPAEWLDRLSTLSIPMASGIDSLNVATAAAVTLHQLGSVRKKS